MLVEHSFITTLEPEAMWARAHEALLALGFARLESDEGDAVIYGRGRVGSQYAKNLAEVGQRVTLHFDRGRVSLAASMEEPRRHRQHRVLLEGSLVALAHALERTLGAEQPLNEARLEWDIATREMEHRDRRRRRNNLILCAISVVVIAGLIVAIAYLTNK